MSVKCAKCNYENTDTAKFCSECAKPLKSLEDIGVTKTIETSVEQLQAGETLAERYEIIEELGKGGMGQVYKVQDKEIKENVALKLLKPEIASDENTIERFRNELKIARRVSHKNVCRMFDIGKANDKYFITMEYVEGEDLKNHIRKKEQLSSKDAIGIAEQICEGLVEAHRLGVVHRDLKPQNIMIDIQRDAKIMDFGIARSLEAPGVTATGVIIGTPDYISPEQAEGIEADQRSDIYSLGVILYEMVTGSVPFKGDTAFSVALKHKSQLPLHPQKHNPDVSDDLSRLILVCMEKDRERRYQTAEALLADLKNIEEGFPLGTKIQPRRKSFVSNLMRHKFFIPASIVVIALFAVLIWQLLPRGEIIAAAPKIKDSIAVISFENLTGDPQHDSFMEAVPSFFISKFETMGFSQVVTWEQLRNLLKQIGKDPNKPIDTETGFAVCKFAGIESLVVGRITKAGNVFATNITVLDTETQNSLASASAQGQGADSLIVSQINDLVYQLSEKINLSPFQTKAIPAMSELTTSSMQAYTYYLQGNDSYRMLYYDEAREHYQKAVEIDPTFAMAHLGLFHTYFQQNNNKAANEKLEMAMVHMDRANPKEKLYIQAWQARMEQDTQKRNQIFKEIVEKYPMELKAHYYLARRLETTNPEEAEKKYQEMLGMDPHYTWALARLIELARRKRDNDLAIEYAKRYISLNPNEPNPYCKLGQTYLEMGQLDQSIEQYRRALTIRRGYRKALDWIVYNYGLKEDYSEAIKWADEFILTSKAPTEKANGYLTKAFIEYWTGSFQRAQKNAERAIIVGEKAQNPMVPYVSLLLQGFIQHAQDKSSLARGSFNKAEEMAIKAHSVADIVYRANKEYFLGSLDIHEGNLEQAQKRLKTIRELSLEDSPQWTNRVKRHEQAFLCELLIAQGSFDKAISLLEPMPIYSISVMSIVSLSAGPVMRVNLIQLETKLAQAYEGKGDFDRAIDVLEKLIPFDPTDSHWRFTPPKIYYDLGRLYEKKWMIDEAQENYTKFLELWKNADPGLSIIEDAKAKLAALKN